MLNLDKPLDHEAIKQIVRTAMIESYLEVQRIKVNATNKANAEMVKKLLGLT